MLWARQLLLLEFGRPLISNKAYRKAHSFKHARGSFIQAHMKPIIRAHLGLLPMLIHLSSSP